MPLKHLTETVLVVALAAVTILTGIVASVLPPIPEGFFAWSVLFVLTVLYPAILYPLLKSNRADYSFRALHFAPVVLVLVWMFLQIAMMKFPILALATTVYSWGFALLPVAVAFVLLAAYCLEVIRRRVPRLTFLTLLLVPFIALAVTSERFTHWDNRLAALITKKPIQIAQNGSSSSLSSTSKGEKNLSSSSSMDEEEWREKMRSVENGSVHSSVSVNVSGPLRGVSTATGLAATSGSNGSVRVAVKPRTHLPKSGGEFEAIALLLIAGFAATMHSRTKRLLA